MNEKFSALLDQTDSRCVSSTWRRQVMTDMATRLEGDTPFPCIFAKNAIRKKIIKLIFVETLDSKGIYGLATGLKEFVEFSRGWDLQVNTASPLIIAFSTLAVHANSVSEYHEKGWGILQQLHELDQGSWPKEVSKDPGDPAWSMCFDGMPLFINMSSPAHEIRRSRNLGKYFMFVINPRERFDIVAGDTRTGRATRKNIRNRIHRYDGIPHSLQLGTYGSQSYEWLQYGLTEENIERADKCPFNFKEKENIDA